MTAPELPLLARITGIAEESADTRTFELSLPGGEGFSTYVPGQFAMLSVFGVGEAAFSLSSAPVRRAGEMYLTVTVRRVGALTGALFERRRDDLVGVRGPYGRGFPAAADEPTLYVAGGCGLSPLKPAIEAQLAARLAGTAVSVVYGSRTADSRIHRAALERWRAEPGARLIECLELAPSGWPGRVGRVPEVLAEVLADVRVRRAFLCGPPALLWRAGVELARLGVEPQQIHVAIERHMKCGTGQCGHCYVNERYACRDGPVFSWSELRSMPDAFRGVDVP